MTTITKTKESLHPEKQLVMISSPIMSKQSMPSNVIGLTDNTNSDKIVIYAPLTVEIAYYASKGKKIQPIVNQDEFTKAKKEESLRTLPQMTSLDWVYSSISDPTLYSEASMSVFIKEGYVVDVDKDSTFGDAYYAMITELTKVDAPVVKHVADTMFSLDVGHYISSMLDPNKIKDIMLPPSPAENKENGVNHIIGNQ